MDSVSVLLIPFGRSVPAAWMQCPRRHASSLARSLSLVSLVCRRLPPSSPIPTPIPTSRVPRKLKPGEENVVTVNYGLEVSQDCAVWVLLRGHLYP
jgi:hypothetical protein